MTTRLVLYAAAVVTGLWMARLALELVSLPLGRAVEVLERAAR